MIQLNTLPGRVIDNKYRIERLLGRGGMGAVYLAQHTGTSRHVALKVIVPESASSSDYLERFRREAQAAGRLRHPNVVDVTDFGVAEVDGFEVAYLVMEYLDGCDLATILEEERRIPVGWALDILDQTCSAVSEAHRRGIVHRDLKPANIWLEPDRLGNYNVKVLDFGLAKRLPPSAFGDEEQEPDETLDDEVSVDEAEFEAPTAVSAERYSGATVPPAVATAGEREDPRTMHENTLYGAQTAASAALPHADPTLVELPEPTDEISVQLTQIGAVMGSPGYMSPEQCRGEDVDWRSDIYSLGVIAYEMLSGGRPFEGKDYKTLLHQTIETTPLPISKVNPDLPGAVCEVVMTTLSKDRDERPQSATVLASTLRASAMGFGHLVKLAIATVLENAGVFSCIFALSFAPIFAIRLYLVHLLIESPKDASRFWLLVLLILAMIVGSFFSSGLARGLSAVVYSLKLVDQNARVKFRALIAYAGKRVHVFARACLVYFGAVTIPIFLAGWALLFASFDVPRLVEEGVFGAPDRAQYIAYAVSLASLAVLTVSLIRYSMLPMIALVEDRSLRESIDRSYGLAVKAPLMIVSLGVVEALVIFALQWFRYMILSFTVYEPVTQLGPMFVDNVERVEIAAMIMVMMIEAIILPILALVYAAVYLKLRYAAGETVEDMIRTEFASEEAPKSGWRRRMQHRLGSHPSEHRSKG